MQEESRTPSFIELVESHLDGEARELWIPLAEEFARFGPDRAKVYLDNERYGLEDTVSNLISEFSSEES